MLTNKHMSIVKSFSVGNGDTFYIKHGTRNFSIIDCCLSDDNRKEIVDEIKLANFIDDEQSQAKKLKQKTLFITLGAGTIYKGWGG